MPRAAWVLTGYLGFLAVAFGVRSVLAARAGYRVFVPPVSTLDAVVNAVWVLGVALTIGAPVLALVDAPSPIGVLDTVGVAVIGAVTAATGAGTALVAQAEMAGSWRAGVDVTAASALVERGLFARMRNPFYLGCILVSVGVALMVPNWFAVLGALVLVGASWSLVRWVEEPHLLAAHGERYDAYRARSGRFLPRLRSGQ